MQKVELVLSYELTSVILIQSDAKEAQSWNSEQIKDFVRKLGFLNKDISQETNLKKFLQYSKVS